MRPALILSAAILIGPLGSVNAEELIDPIVTTTTTSVTSPLIVTTTTSVVEPVVEAPVVVVPVAEVAVPVVPAGPNRIQDIVSWKKLEGTVASVDRNNLAMIVQDREGKDIRVTFNNNIQIYRRGEQIPYSAVEPNDRVVLRYDTRSTKTE